jgi:hypothetical protein
MKYMKRRRGCDVMNSYSMMQVAVVSLTTLHEHTSGERMARMICGEGGRGGGWEAAQSHKRNVCTLMNNPAILKFSSSEPKTTQTRKATASSVI